MTHLHRFNSLSKLLASAALITAVVLMFNACGDTTVTPDNCSISISSFNVSPKTFAAGATLTGSITFADNVGLDDLTARSVTELYLSADAAYSSSDTQLDAFTDPPTHSGSNTTVVFDQIDIPNGISAGSYYIVARIDSQPCGGGESSTATTKSVAVTVN